MWNFWPNIGKKFIRSFKLIWFDKKNHFAYMKDERPNLNIMIIAFKFVVNCDILGVEESFQKKWFGHAFCKAC
jgi:hypothetical protein